MGFVCLSNFSRAVFQRLPDSAWVHWLRFRGSGEFSVLCLVCGMVSYKRNVWCLLRRPSLMFLHWVGFFRASGRNGKLLEEYKKWKKSKDMYSTISLLLYEPYANESSQICPFLAVQPQFESVHYQNRRLSSHSYSHESVICFVFLGLIFLKLRRVCVFCV